MATGADWTLTQAPFTLQPRVRSGQRLNQETLGASAQLCHLPAPPSQARPGVWSLWLQVNHAA